MTDNILTPRQKEVWDASFSDPKKWNISVGAVRSGKTYLDYFRIPRRIMQADPMGTVILVGNTEGTLERNILSPMRRMYGGKLVGKIKGGGSVRLFGRDCYALGAYRKGCADKLQGTSISYCYGDEITTWNEDVFKMLISRLDRKGSCFDGSCNPAEPSHWFKQFIDRDGRPDEMRVSVFSIDDNTFLPPEFIESVKREYAGSVYYDRYILGQWKSAEGAIYRQFADRPGDFVIKSRDIPEIIMADMGVDFGGNGSATAFNLTGYTAGYKYIVTLDEYYKKDIMSPAELERDFSDFVIRVRKKYPMLRDVYCDSAEQVLIRGLKNAAAAQLLPVEIHNARKGDISQRIRFYCSLMSRGRYKIADKCRHTIGAFCNAVWDGGGSDRRLDDGIVNIDSLDAQEYSTESRMNEILMY